MLLTARHQTKKRGPPPKTKRDRPPRFEKVEGLQLLPMQQQGDGKIAGGGKMYRRACPHGTLQNRLDKSGGKLYHFARNDLRGTLRTGAAYAGG